MQRQMFVVKKRKATRSATGRRRTYRLSEKPEKSKDAVIAHFRGKIMEDAAIAEGPDGPYTWVVTYPGPHLYAARVRTEQELGTLHANLFAYSGGTEVGIAGEFLKAGKEVLYNLQSGTYMARKFPKRAHPEDNAATRDALKARAEARFTALGLTPRFNTAPTSAPDEQIYAGLPIIDTMEILATISEMANYDRLLSGTSGA